MRDLGNTVLVVEHDDDTMRAADWIIDMGARRRRARRAGVAAGTPEQIMQHPTSLTGAYLSAASAFRCPPTAVLGNGKWLVIKGARENNLKNIDVRIPARQIRGRHRRQRQRQVIADRRVSI
jgi:excinuclease ABC subunit A